MPTPPTKPTSFPTWGTGLTAPADIVEPDIPRKVAGFDVPNQKPARNWVNWLFRRIGEWLEYLDETVSDFRAPVVDSVADGINSIKDDEPFLVRETVPGVSTSWSHLVDAGEAAKGVATDGLRIYVSTDGYTAALDPRTGARQFDFEAFSEGLVPGGRTIATDGRRVVYSDNSPGGLTARSMAAFSALAPPPLPVNGAGFPYWNPDWTYNHGTSNPAGIIWGIAIAGEFTFAVGGRSDGSATTPLGMNLIVLDAAGAFVVGADVLGTHSETCIAVMQRTDTLFEVYVSTDDEDGFGYDVWAFGGHVRRFEFDANAGTLTLRGSCGDGLDGPWNAVRSLAVTRDALFVGTDPCIEYWLDLANLQPDDDAAGPNSVVLTSAGFTIATWTNTGAADPVTVSNVLRDLVASWAAIAAGGSAYAKSWRLVIDGTKLLIRRTAKAGATPDPEPFVIAIAHPADNDTPSVRGFNLWRLDPRTMAETWRVSASTGLGVYGPRTDLTAGGSTDGDGTTQAVASVAVCGSLVVAAVTSPTSMQMAQAFDAETGALVDTWTGAVGLDANGIASDGMACYIGHEVASGLGDPSLHRIGFDIRPAWFVIRDGELPGYRTGLRAQRLE